MIVGQFFFSVEKIALAKVNGCCYTGWLSLSQSRSAKFERNPAITLSLLNLVRRPSLGTRERMTWDTIAFFWRADTALGTFSPVVELWLGGK